MRVALVCPYDVSRPGGVQGQVLGLARALGVLGHDSVVLAPADAPVPPPGPRAQVVGLGRAVPVPANGSVAPVALNPLVAARARRAVREAEVDVVHLHEPLAPVAGYGCLLAGREPMIATFHRAGAGVGYRLLGALARPVARRLAVRCAVSPEAAATASAVLPGAYEVVGNGVDVDRFATSSPWPAEGPTVLFVGRHERRKGLGVLLEAFGRLDPTRATLWVVGRGPETEALRTRLPAHSQVRWLGQVDDDELASRLAGADVLCAPSLGGESFGMVLVEAMAAGTPVVASDIPGYAFVAGEHARLVSPGDAGALAAALAEVLTDAEHAVGVASPAALDRARAHAAHWSMARLAERYVARYEAAAATAPGH